MDDRAGHSACDSISPAKHQQYFPEKAEGLAKDEKSPDDSRSSTTSDAGSVASSSESRARRQMINTAVALLSWKPKNCEYDPEKPPRFSKTLNSIYAIVRCHVLGTRLSLTLSQAGCVTVANLYYNQPVLNKIAETFDVSFESASSVATLMQSGYAAGLLFLCPLGDTVRRRPFILGLVWFTATAVSVALRPVKVYMGRG
jgi:hypothetical protein